MRRDKQRLELTWFNKDQVLIPSEVGRYGYTWVSPFDPRYCETHTLVMDDYVTGYRAEKEPGTVYSDRADLPPTTDNLLVHGESGDLLEALTRLPELAEKYLGKVRCIALDPPFNTQNFFVHYEDNLEHSIWLTMMRDRLHHVRRLLSDDGTVWIHLDEVESHRMRLLLDEVFGAENFIAEIAVEINPKGRQLGDGLARSTDSLVAYAKSPAVALTTGDAASVNLEDFPRVTEDGVPFRYLPLRNTNKKFNPDTAKTMYFPLYGDADTGRVASTPFAGSEEIWPVFGDGSPAVWRWSAAKVDAQSNELRARTVGGRLGKRLDVSQIDTAGQDRTKKFKTVWLSDDIGSSDSAKNEIEALFPDVPVFSTPKPEKLLERILYIATDPGDIVVDVFGGSGTTAAVAHKMGRRWVTCELIADTFDTFTRPRLEKVVRGEDPGGASISKGIRVDATADGLPKEMKPDEAAQLTTLLNKAIRHVPAWKNDAVVKAIKSGIKTRKNTIVNWRGGGGFQIAHLSPACFDFDTDAGVVVLTDDAQGATLTKAVAAHLGYRLTPEDPVFDGVKGMSQLVVTRTPLTADLVVELAGNLDDAERLTVAATVVLDGAREALRKAVPGSRVVHVPDDLFPSASERLQR